MIKNVHTTYCGVTFFNDILPNVRFHIWYIHYYLECNMFYDIYFKPCPLWPLAWICNNVSHWLAARLKSARQIGICLNLSSNHGHARRLKYLRHLLISAYLARSRLGMAIKSDEISEHEEQYCYNENHLTKWVKLYFRISKRQWHALGR